MNVHFIPATTLVGSVLLTVFPSLSHAQPQQAAAGARVLEVSSVAPGKSTQLASLIAEIRRQADAFVFLSGGPSRMREDHQRQLLGYSRAWGWSQKPAAVSRSEMEARRRGLWKLLDTHAAQAATHFR